MKDITTQQLNNQPPRVFRFLRLPGQHPVVHAVDVVRGLREVRLRGHHARHIRLRQRDARLLTGKHSVEVLAEKPTSLKWCLMF